MCYNPLTIKKSCRVFALENLMLITEKINDIVPKSPKKVHKNVQKSGLSKDAYVRKKR